jgi:hypothetical protein
VKNIEVKGERADVYLEGRGGGAYIFGMKQVPVYETLRFKQH